MDDILGPEIADHDIEWGADPVSAHADGRERERQYVERCREAMTPGCKGWSYLRGRGFTDDEIRRFGFGYDPQPSQGYKDSDGNDHRAPRVIVPFLGCGWYHTDRAIAGDATGKKYVKPSSDMVGKQPFFNPDALDSDVVFVVEGLMDAYAIEAEGYQAIATAGTATRETVNAISGRGYQGTVVALLDFDGHGRDANGKLVEALSEEHVAVYAPSGFTGTLTGCKDCSEALQTDREALAEYLEDASRSGVHEAEKAALERYDEAMEKKHVLSPSAVAQEIYDLVDVDEPVPTGLSGLDDAIGGGLHRGLTVLGAISSLGKTTLCVQIADHIAESGRTVLFVTIEQSARELVAKSITRIMRQRSGCNVSTRELTSRSARASWNQRTNDALMDALNYYESTTAGHVRIYDGAGDERPSAKSIRTIAEAMRQHDGQPPVVFVDYLQLLPPCDERDSDRKAVDANMTALRLMARDLDTSVVAISSLNRASYSGSISLDSFKESGGIEYGADLLLGLQPYGMADRLDNVSDKKLKSAADKLVRENKALLERPEEVVLLKNRTGGIPAQGVPLTFYPVVSLFRDGLHGQGNGGMVRERAR